MKTLLTTILILLSATVIGQYSKPMVIGNDTIYPSLNQTITQIMDSNGVVFITRGFHPNTTDHQIKNSLLWLLEEYETDCYNDSTAYYYYRLCGLDKVIRYGWHHKEPTFKGFINWLKKR